MNKVIVKSKVKSKAKSIAKSILSLAIVSTAGIVNSAVLEEIVVTAQQRAESLPENDQTKNQQPGTGLRKV